jgi:transcriptional regulator with PAS, ATPase and Fis domain
MNEAPSCIRTDAIAADRMIADSTSTQSAASAVFSDCQTLRSYRREAEIRAIRLALQRTGWIRKRAAKILAISYRSLLYKIERYQITPPSAGSVPALVAQEHAGEPAWPAE